MLAEERLEKSARQKPITTGSACTCAMEHRARHRHCPTVQPVHTPETTRTSDVSQDHCPERQESARVKEEESPYIKEEQQEFVHIKDVSGKLLFPEYVEPDCPPIEKEEDMRENPNIKMKDPFAFKKEESRYPHVAEEMVMQIKKEDELPCFNEEADIADLTFKPLKSEDEAGKGLKHLNDGGSSTDGLMMKYDNKRYKCPQCGKGFGYKMSLKRHRSSHTGEKPFACTACDKKFTEKGDLKIHTRIHTGEKPFACSVCGQTFTQRQHLKSHTRTHTGEKPFSCSVCGQRFSLKGGLEIHTRTHTGEKPFFCSFCGQRFSQKGSLEIHIRTHTGEKPFSCSFCGKGFPAKSDLTKHTRTHTGEKPFSCPICGQKFTAKRNLEIHTRTHTGEKPFSCSFCGQRFSWKDQVMRHACVLV
ncbi:zinc finger protein OZF-like isoform X1 [Corythoichthys intestinalis]|uniref:zinc finger protein OZF-like isoform X1 n=1 Tax=Corythoichthys intestinalis TaxID=161448 RepID=UPI0025A536A7|nr:zinc finger protein OZF-like isoform X1 [Corythoichthys intestinalis]